MDKYAELLQLIETYELLAVAEKVYGPYEMGNRQRKIVIIIDDQGKRKTRSLPAYLMEQHLGRPLTKDETVQHLDGDVNNNDFENLTLLPRSEHSKEDTRRVKLVEFNCSNCGKKFERSPRLVRDKNKKGVSGIFCGRSCAGVYSRKLQLGQIDKLPTQPFVESEYYTLRDTRAHSLQEVAMSLLAKHGKTLAWFLPNLTANPE